MYLSPGDVTHHMPLEQTISKLGSFNISQFFIDNSVFSQSLTFIINLSFDNSGQREAGGEAGDNSLMTH